MGDSEKFQLSYSLLENLELDKMKNQFIATEEDKNIDYNPFIDVSLSNYNPTYSVFFNMDETNYDKIGFNNKYQMIDLETVKNMNTMENEKKDIFIKFSPLLDPIRYMIGKYDVNNNNIRTLPKYNNENVHEKIESVNNSSYVDNFFSFLSSKLLHHNSFSNGIDYFGSFLTVQNKYKMNVSDDFEYLGDSSFFSDHLNKLFSISRFDLFKQHMNYSRTNRNKLNISENDVEYDCDIIPLEEVAILTDEIVINDLEEVYTKDEKQSVTSDEDDDSEEENGDENDSSEEDFGEDSDEDSEDDDDSEESMEENVFAYINNFPVQMICLEKCDGTIDELFENGEINEENGSAALLQIIMTLITYQKAFHFTHNDLHTNNIVYKLTDEEFIYYKYNNNYYKVPTYGKIFKIIDFGRSIYKYKGKIFCSDSFKTGGDAATQYNCEPFYNKNKPRIEPNMSFDLCRLGCSIYDFIIDEEEYEDMDELQKTVYRWCTDDKNLNILYKKNGSERYPDFKLYKMIARTVHKHIPEKQLEFDFFSQYLIQIIEENTHIIDIDKVENYSN